MEIIKIVNPRYLESGAIDCEIQFAGMSELLPFTAMKDDDAPIGQEIWTQLLDGKWGTIKPCTVTDIDLEHARKDKKAQIEIWRAEQEAREFTVKWNKKTWQAGQATLARLQPIVLAIATNNAKSVIVWGDVKNNQVKLTYEQLHELATIIAQEQMQYNGKIYNRQRELKDRVDKLTSIQEIRDLRIDWE